MRNFSVETENTSTLCNTSSVADWNIYIYIAEEDKTLTSPFFYSLQKITNEFKYNNINVFVLHRAVNFYGSYKMVIKANSTTIMNRLETDIDMLNPQTLYSFIKENSELCPAKKNALFIQCHSNGWFAKQSAEEKRIKPYPELFSLLVKDGYHFDIFGLSTCLISTIEIAYEFRNFCDYIIAPEMSSPIIPMWSTTFFYAFSNANYSVEEVAKQICADFITMNNNLPQKMVDSKLQIATDISLLKTSKVEELVDVVREIDLSKLTREAYLKSRVNPEGFEGEYGHFYLVNDLYTSVKYTCDDIKLMEKFTKVFNEVVILYYQTHKLKSNNWSKYMYGLGYVPCWSKSIEHGYTYKTLELYKFWDKFSNCEYI